MAASYDLATPPRRNGCKGGGPILDAMPPRSALVEVMEGRGDSPVPPPSPPRFAYADAARVLHECGGISFEFGPFRSSSRLFLARIWMHTSRNAPPSRMSAASRSTRRQSLQTLDEMKFSAL